MGSNLVITKEIENYINNHSVELSAVQKEIILYNNSLGDIKRMQISISQCHFLHLIVKISNIKKILEIGTFTGLSGLTMALSLPANGELVTLDKSSERNKIATNFFKKEKQEKKIKSIIGPAIESINILKKKGKKFDLVFIDADKENYKNYYNQSFDLLEKNGLIIVDNVLWHGEVVDSKKQDKLTTIIRDFNSYINKDKRTENLIIPIGDGLSVCRKL
ncbi:MAG: SAM-dependent methyltransferase [Candidatus Pelagibacterales bacterium]|nr:MAG: SAM-dependent methyltransferase [Pelagibacterales bacterium]